MSAARPPDTRPLNGAGGTNHDHDDPATRSAVLDDMHTGDIRGALGTIRLDDTAPRRGLSRKARTR